jgi:LysM repeat protein
MRTLTIGIFVLAAIVLGFSFWLLTRGDDEENPPTNPTETETSTQSTATTPAGGGGTTSPGTGTPGTTPTGTTTPGTGTPSSGEGTYVVQEGDTCGAIAEANGVTLEDFLAANPAIDADCTNLQVGQEVVIP